MSFAYLDKMVYHRNNYKLLCEVPFMKVSVLLAALGLAGCLTACAPKTPDTLRQPATAESAAPTAAPAATAHTAAAQPPAPVGNLKNTGARAGRNKPEKTPPIGD